MSLAWLDEIEARANAATPGPWSIGHWYAECAVNDGTWRAPRDVPPGECAMCGGGHELVREFTDKRGTKVHIHRVAWVGEDAWHNIVSDATFGRITGNYGYEEGGVCSTPEDAQFIAAARTDVPKLCRAVRELHARLRALRVAAESVLMAHDEAAASENPRIIQEALQALKTQVVEATMTEARWN